MDVRICLVHLSALAGQDFGSLLMGRHALVSHHTVLVAFLVRTRLQLGLNALRSNAFEVYYVWLCVQTRLQLHLNTFALNRI